jgi:anti-sigma regulatory factor (Ser/Thr protein kinase)
MMVESRSDCRPRDGSSALQLQFERDARAPGLARAAVLARCGDFDLDPSACNTLMLLVSELVSNAVIHSRGPLEEPIALGAKKTETGVRITVTDAGEGFTPVPRKPGVTQGGYGLYLVHKTAESWGVDRVGGTRVWFELPRNSA